MEKRMPTLTPYQVMQILTASEIDKYQQDGWTYTLDGPQPCPIEGMAPVAHFGDDEDDAWFTTGEPGDETTPADTWVQ